MKIIEDKKLTATILDRIRNRKRFPPKGPADDFMLTELTTCLNKTVLKRRNPRPVDDDLLVLFTMGHAIQAYLTGTFKSEKSKCIDGIWMGIDYLDREPGGLPWECKMTFMSSDKPPLDHWVKQIMGYCRALDVTVFALPRVCMMGDWSWVFRRKDRKVDDRHPILSVQRLEFTQAEIDANWAWVLRRRDVTRKALDAGTMPSEYIADYAEKWECDRCEYYADCPHPLIVKKVRQKNDKTKRQGTGGKGSQRPGTRQSPTGR